MNTNTRQTSFLTRAALTLLLFFVCAFSARSATYVPCSVNLSSGQESASCVGGSVSSNGAHVTVSPRTDFRVARVSWSYTLDDGTEGERQLTEDQLSGGYNAGGAYGTVTVSFKTETENVQVTFNLNGYGGEAPATQDLSIGDKVTRPDDPTDENYEFFGWYYDAACTIPFDFDVALSYSTPYASYTDSNASASPHFNLVIYAKGRAYVEGYCGKVDDTHDGKQLTWSGYKYFPGDVIDVLTISGNGEMADGAFSRGKLNTVIINEGVTTIGQYAFYICTSLSSVTIPSSVTTIGSQAFYRCSGLKSVTIPSSVTSIGQGVFCDCSSLTSVTIPSSVTSIGQDAFMDCTSLSSITIPSSVTTIGEGAFMSCTSLSSVTIPASVTTIGQGVFCDCSSLTSVTIPSSVTSIGQDAFMDCTSLSSVTIPSSVTSIGQGVFWSCTSLTSVTIYAPPLATYGKYAFDINADGRKIYVYSDFVDDYKAGWPEEAGNIKPIPNATISALTLADNTDNTSAIAVSDGKLADVTLQGRTLYKDGSWNTLCLPFALDATRTAELLEYPEALMTLKSTSFEGGTLTLTFEDATAIEAGKPYIVKWTRATDYTDDNTHNLYAPTFSCVPITQSTASVKTQDIDFVGSYSPISLSANDNTVLYLGADNTLYYPSTAMTIGSCRAYFQLKGDLTAGDSGPQAIRAFKLNFGEETGLETVHGEGFMVNGEGFMVNGFGWYTLDGRRLDAQPAAPGIYLHNGRKLLIK